MKGDKGETGEQGPKGDTGPQGEKGEKGDPGEIPDPGQPHMQLVSDVDGKAVWEEKLAWKEVAEGTVVVLPETEWPGVDDDDGDGVMDTYAMFTPLDVYPEAGKTYKVTVNGTAYDCTALDISAMMPGFVLMGRSDMMDMEGGNPDAPFMLVAGTAPEYAMDGAYAFAFCTLGTESLTVSITYTGEQVKVKKIDPDFLPGGKQIIITIEKNGNDVTVTSDTPFADAWAMTPGELQQAIVIKESSAYKGNTATTVETVSKVENALSGTMGNLIHMRVREAWEDTSDYNDRDNTRYLTWAADGTIAIDSKQLNALPILDSNATGQYLRWSGSSWLPVSIDQLKADLGLT